MRQPSVSKFFFGKPALAAVSLAAAILGAAPAQASVINFDDLNAGTAFSAMTTRNPYDGFTWSSNFLLGKNTFAGYDNGAHSGTNFVNNRGASGLTVTNASAFDFAGAWFAAPNITGGKASWINISAFDAGGALIGSTGNIAIGSAYSYIAANFAAVSKISIARDNGFFVMDDFTLTDAQVPEPSGLFALALGAAAVAGLRRKGRAPTA